MCKICDGYGNGEVCKKIESNPISIGSFENVWALEAWLMIDPKDDQSEKPRLYITLSETCCYDDISDFSIPIKYCPFCGRKL